MKTTCFFLLQNTSDIPLFFLFLHLFNADKFQTAFPTVPNSTPTLLSLPFALRSSPRTTFTFSTRLVSVCSLRGPGCLFTYHGVVVTIGRCPATFKSAEVVGMMIDAFGATGRYLASTGKALLPQWKLPLLQRFGYSGGA